MEERLNFQGTETDGTPIFDCDRCGNRFAGVEVAEGHDDGEDEEPIRTITVSEVKNTSNWTVWGGYMETPASFNPLGDQWLLDLAQYDGNLVEAIEANLDDICETLEANGFKVVEDKPKGGAS